jgi:hypothetical protein
MGFGGSYFTEGLGLFVRHWFMFTVTVVLGISVGAACIAAGMLVDGTLSVDGQWHFSFGLMASLGVSVGVFGVGVIATRIFLAPESSSVWTWAMLIAVEIATSMVIVTNAFRGHRLAMSVAWFCGIVLTVLSGRGLWWLNAWMDRRWVAQLRKLQEENSLWRLERQEPRWARPPVAKGLPLDVPPLRDPEVRSEKEAEDAKGDQTRKESADG